MMVPQFTDEELKSLDIRDTLDIKNKPWRDLFFISLIA